MTAISSSSAQNSHWDKARSPDGLRIRIGPFSVCVRSSLKAVNEGLNLLYADYPVLDENAFIDFYVRLKTPSGFRGWYRPQALFEFDGQYPFKPLPLSQAFAFFEWGLNWCFAQHSNQYLIYHAAVIERSGQAIILPAPPGSGKSTLCAALMHRGWRLLSDELCMIDRNTGQIVPVPRPASLKNESINVMREFAPEAVIGPTAHDTAKGSVAHLKIPKDMLDRQDETATPALVVLPKFQKGSPVQIEDMDKAHMFMEVATNAFNYSVLGAEAYDMTADLVDRCDCLRFTYSKLDDAIQTFERFID